MENWPLISIVTINYNSLKDTLELMASLKACGYPKMEVIVVDNYSLEDPIPELRSEFPEYTSIRTDKNLGFAGGNNFGLKEANGKYIFFLNNDTIVNPEFFPSIIKFAEKHDDIGILTPKIIYGNGKTIQYAGAKGINPFTGRGKRIGRGEEDHGQYDKIYKTELGHGCAMMVPKAAIEVVGTMPECYFLYYEEHDWAQLFMRKGYDIYYFGKAHILHKESMSVGKESPIKTYYLSRNRLLYIKRNVGGLNRYLALSFAYFISFPVNFMRLLIGRKFDLLRAYINGVVWHFQNKVKYD